jgi:5'-nucleotidase
LRRSRYSLAAALALASSAALIAVPAVAEAKPKPSIPVQLLAMNDFHGRIQLTSGNDALLVTGPGDDGVYGTSDDKTETVGGAANVAATVEQLQSSFRAANGADAASYFVGAGDLISASPFVSSSFKDEPTIEVLNAMGLDASSVGNHEFDRGTEELRRISAATDGTYTDDVKACAGVSEVAGTGCFTDSTGKPFHGTDFPYLAANVVSKSTGEPMLPPYQIFDVGGGEKIGLIGVVTKDTPNIVSPDGVADVQFIDEADAINYWTPRLIRQGIKAIGVLIHEGGEQKGAAAANPNGCDQLAGPIVDINNRVSDQVDVIVSAHTHQAYNCLLPVPGGSDRLVTSAGYYGRAVSDIRLMIKPTSGDVDRQATYAATNVPVVRGQADAKVQDIVDYWAQRAQKSNPVVGSVTADIKRAYKGTTEDRESESSLGNLIAQTQLVALQQPQYGNPVIGLMNPGGLRADILFGKSASGEAPGVVTYSELSDVQPFGNVLGATTLSGADIKQILEEQFQVRGQRNQLMLGTSDGFAFSYDLSRNYGDRITSVTLNGIPLDPATGYRVVTNTYLLQGGDQFPSFLKGTNTVSGPVDLEATVAYFQTHSPVSPPLVNHTTRVG